MQPSNTRVVEYRPNKTLGFAFAALFILTAAILLWVGSILGPDDVASVDGFNRILFTVVPISLFSWAGASVFTVLGLLIARQSLRTDPTLTISDDGATLANGTAIQWSDVISVEAKESELVLTIAEDVTGNGNEPRKTKARRTSWWRRGTSDHRLVMSSLALGADPARVKTEIESRMDRFRTTMEQV
jgi:hypothetical protein